MVNLLLSIKKQVL